MAFDRHRPLAVQPGAPGLQHEGESPDGGGRILDPEGGRGFARPDLDAQIGTVQPVERVLVGHVVAEEHHGARGELHAQRVDRGALVRGDHGQLDDRLAVRDVDVRPGFRPVLDRVEDGVGHVGRTISHMYGDRCRFALQAYARDVLGEREQCGVQPFHEVPQFRRETLDEADVEFAAV